MSNYTSMELQMFKSVNDDVSALSYEKYLKPLVLSILSIYKNLKLKDTQTNAKVLLILVYRW